MPTNAQLSKEVKQLQAEVNRWKSAIYVTVCMGVLTVFFLALLGTSALIAWIVGFHSQPDHAIFPRPWASTSTGATTLVPTPVATVEGSVKEDRGLGEGEVCAVVEETLSAQEIARRAEIAAQCHLLFDINTLLDPTGNSPAILIHEYLAIDLTQPPFSHFSSTSGPSDDLNDLEVQEQDIKTAVYRSLAGRHPVREAQRRIATACFCIGGDADDTARCELACMWKNPNGAKKLLQSGTDGSSAPEIDRQPGTLAEFVQDVTAKVGEPPSPGPGYNQRRFFDYYTYGNDNKDDDDDNGDGGGGGDDKIRQKRGRPGQGWSTENKKQKKQKKQGLADFLAPHTVTQLQIIARAAQVLTERGSRALYLDVFVVPLQQQERERMKEGGKESKNRAASGAGDGSWPRAAGSQPKQRRDETSDARPGSNQSFRREFLGETCPNSFPSVVSSRV